MVNCGAEAKRRAQLHECEKAVRRRRSPLAPIGENQHVHRSNRSTLVWHLWETLARENPTREAIIHRDALGDATRWTYGALLEAAEGFAANLLEAGVDTGDVCAIILRHHKDFYPIYLGVAAIGALPAVLAYPNQRLHPAKFRHGLTGMSQRSGLDWILTDSELSPIVAPLAAAEGSSIRGLLFPLEWQAGHDSGAAAAEKRRTLRAHDPFLLQHSGASEAGGPLAPGRARSCSPLFGCHLAQAGRPSSELAPAVP